ncbi:MAG: exo-alpha-sialidase [Bacteroidaceae bacterium]|nr:exo-alpha-sialidase [Bacteroidaceae bacterium]
MRQKLILFLAVLFSTIGTWAATYTVNVVDGTQNPCGTLSSRTNNNTMLTSLAASGFEGLVLTAGAFDQANWLSSRCLAIKPTAARTPEKVTISAPSGYKITGYTIECFSVSPSNCPYYIDTAEQYTGSLVPGSKTTYTVTDISASSTYFWIYANAATVANWLGVSSFVVYLADDSGATLVDVTYELYSGETLLKSVTVKQEAGGDINIPSNLINGYSSIAYDAFTTEGSIGDSNSTIKVYVNPKPGLVEVLGDLSNAKAYTIQCERGYYTTVDGSLANTVKNSNFSVNNFAIISYEDTYYLWSIADEKFVSCDGAALGTFPVAITMTNVAPGLFKFQGNGKTMNATSGFATGGGFDSWTTTDQGNSCAIIAVADFDATDILAAIEVLHSTKSLNFSVNITGTTEAENTRAGKITMTLRDKTLTKFLSSDSEETDLQYLDATFTATATSYRGYEFTGFTIGDVDFGTSIEIGELADVASGATLVANYTASTGNGLNLWYDYNDSMTDAYRIPAIVRTQGGRLIAFADYRPGNTDVGGGATSIERRYSDDNGETWSPALRVAQGNWGVNTSNVIEWSFGDAAVVADNTPGNSGNDVLMICCGGNSLWTGSTYNPDTSQKQQGCVRWRSADGGVTWGSYEYIMPDIMQAFVDAGLRAADGSSGIVRAFFTSGKITQSVRKAEGAQYNRLYCAVDVPDKDVVMYSDDFGETWVVLGGGIANNGDEAHLVELPDGDLLLVGRGGSSRWVNVFNYTDFNTAAGQWDTQGQWNNAVATSCNGDVEVVEAYDAYGEKSTVIVETAPMYSSQRRDIQYYFIALPKAEGFSVTDFSTIGGASWTQGMNVTHNWSAYSSLLGNGDGTFDILFEESAKNETKSPTGYCIVYQTGHDIKDITNSQYFFNKEQAEAEGVKTPRPGHFYRFKSTRSDACLADVNGVVKVAETDEASSIWYYGSDGLVSYCQGLYLDCNARGYASVGVSYKAAIEPNTYYEGKYTIQTNNRYCYHRDSNGTIDRGSGYNNDEGYAWIVEEVPSLPVSVGELGLATLYSPVGLTASEGVKVYAATKNEAYNSIHFDEVEAVKAGAGVLVEAEAGTYDFAIESNEADYESDLSGNVATVATSSIAAAVYTLQSGPVFKQYSGETLKGFRCYAEADAGSGVKAFDVIFDDNGTGLKDLKDLKDSGELIYNISGQRLLKAQKGFNIINGKKVLR